MDGKGEKALIGNERERSNKDFHCQYQTHEKNIVFIDYLTVVNWIV